MMMMMIKGDTIRSNPTIQVPPWDSVVEDPTAVMPSPFSASPTGNGHGPFDEMTALRRYLPSNVTNESEDGDDDDFDLPVDAFSCDQFRMYEFKVRRCARARSHDWTDCPFAHPGEKARRRDPRKFHYCGNPCPDFRKGCCTKGDGCEYAHGVFECWLHPSRYRTQPCKDGTHCRRRVCFFAHSPDQLRVLTQGSRGGSVGESAHGSPGRFGLDSFSSYGSSSPAGSPTSEDVIANAVGGLSISPRFWGSPVGSGFGSPRGSSAFRPGFASLPTTPTRNASRVGPRVFDAWDQGGVEEEPVMERVESGKELRAKIYAKLGRENSLGRPDSSTQCPDVGWVSELVK